MKSFQRDGRDIAFIDKGEGEPILLIHGFASNHFVNWVAPGWVKTLRDAGYRAIALDNLGHGSSGKSHDPEDYAPPAMAADAVALLDHLGISAAHVMGYSMGARITAFLARDYPDRVKSIILGGLGLGMVEGVGEWDEIADALRAPDPATVTGERPRMFRTFADQTKSDRLALAACIQTSRALLTPEDMARIDMPALVAVGTRDDIAGNPAPLAEMMPHGQSFDIQGRDHMLSVGDRTFKKRALEFLESVR
ncbi:alpha/beta fold hydrolase [Nitratireductor basaltis]|uniref:Alpha/beta hydrolase n=1 Tax=Nitratireductor basaltis TaxID=472175 RepID=A0A084UAS1_9HYPH|nr:alpha/beta hydrolase [Nitratireductor basaltis]KFB10057.1 Alpha/beta hydrolase [Nitratireductor basaltis]